MRPTDLSLNEKVSKLLDPDSYRAVDPRAQSVTAIETHMSWVFLTNDFVYKLKKPVFRPPLDFRTLAQRHFYCAAEVRLNQRLSKNVYLEILPFSETQPSNFLIGREGHPIEWLVWSRRLDLSTSLEMILLHPKRSQSLNIDPLIAKISDFFRSIERIHIPSNVYLKHLRFDLCRTSNQLTNPVYNLDSKKIIEFSRLLYEFIDRHAQLLRQRAESGFIVHGHGDLRPEHIFFDESLQIIDCLEFCLDLRCLDTVSELSLLMIECQRLHAESIGEEIVLECLKSNKDMSGKRLLGFYCATKSLQRALLSTLHTTEPECSENSRIKWQARAQSYLNLTDYWINHLD